MIPIIATKIFGKKVSFQTKKMQKNFFLKKKKKVDLSFSKAPGSSVPESLLDISDSTLKNSRDLSSVQSMNGVRDTQFILKTVGENKQSFLNLLKMIKIWAKRREMYSGKLGFMGGYSWAILCAYVIKKEKPSESSSKDDLLKIFFSTFSNWEWDKNFISIVDNTNYKIDPKVNFLKFILFLFLIISF